MHHFVYCKGVLHAEDVPLPEIAADVGTPFYCYSSATLTRHYLVFRDALKDLDATICFAMKANSNLAVLRTLADLGSGCDVVSGGEFQVALKAGIDWPVKCMVAGAAPPAACLSALPAGAGALGSSWNGAPLLPRRRGGRARHGKVSAPAWP